MSGFDRAMTYLPRIIDAELADLLGSAGAVLVEGPRATGKTATATRAAASEVLLDIDDNARRMIAADAAAVLDGSTPRLIDEWQLEPAIWNHVRREIDRRGAPGQFILTGSAVPADDAARHTGAGRFVRLRIRPLSLYESGRSSGEISLRRLFDGEEQRAPQSVMSIAAIAELICAGGWPGHIGRPLPGVLRVNRGYLDDVRRTDVSRASGKTRDPVKVGRLLRSLARNVATPAALSTLAVDAGEAGHALKPDTVTEYLDALDRLMVLENQPAWSPHLRSRTTLRQTPVRHFVDPSLAVAALQVTPSRLMDDLQFLGLLFESLVVRDLRVHAQAADAQVFHYREKDGLEVDAVIEAADGRWAAFEIKLGERWVEEGARNLRRLARRMEQSDHGKPSALAVIVPAGYGHVQPGEVGVIPIGALGP